jgi:hypothetical protein
MFSTNLKIAFKKHDLWKIGSTEYKSEAPFMDEDSAPNLIYNFFHTGEDLQNKFSPFI